MPKDKLTQEDWQRAAMAVGMVQAMLAALSYGSAGIEALAVWHSTFRKLEHKVMGPPSERGGS